jgi:hypothetical protein
MLAQQLREPQQRMERQAELLLSVMHVEPQMVILSLASLLGSDRQAITIRHTT